MVKSRLMAASDHDKPRTPGRSQRQADNGQSVGPAWQGFGANTPEVGKSTGYQFFDRKILPLKQELNYGQFLQDPVGLQVLEFLKKESIRSVETDYEASPSEDVVVLERTEPIVVEKIAKLPWSRDLGDHEIRLVVEYSVDVTGDTRLFHIVLHITVTSLDRKRPKFREQTVSVAFDHRGSGGAAKKKWKASGPGARSHIG